MALPFPMAAAILVLNKTKGIDASAQLPEYAQCGSIDCESVCKADQTSFQVLGMNPGDSIQVTGKAFTVENVGEIGFSRPPVERANTELWIGACKKSNGGGRIATTTTCCPLGTFFGSSGAFLFDFTVDDNFINIAQSAGDVPTLFVKITDGSAFGTDVSKAIGYSREIPFVVTTNTIQPCIPIPLPGCSNIKPNSCPNPPCDKAGITPTPTTSLFNCGPLQPICNAALVIGILAAIGIGVYIASPAIRAGIGAARGAVKKRVSRKRNSKSA